MTETYFDGENELTVVHIYGPDLLTTKYYYKGVLHRKDGPAIVYYENGNIEKEKYWVDGKMHRSDGPTEIWHNGNIELEEYRINGNLHRLDGPAVIWYNEKRREVYYWVNGMNINTEQFNIDFENYPLSLEDQLLLKMSL